MYSFLRRQETQEQMMEYHKALKVNFQKMKEDGTPTILKLSFPKKREATANQKTKAVGYCIDFLIINLP